MNNKVLCVDDEEKVLTGIRRALRRQFDLSLARNADEAEKLIATAGPFAVVVSDMRMPGRSGLDLFRSLKTTHLDTVRIMLTGNADQQTAVNAVNEGSIFRFLTKPCSPDTLAIAITAGLEQHRLITAEREVLEQTLSGSVRLLTEILSLINPAIFGKSQRVATQMEEIADALDLPDRWELHVAGMLHAIGEVTLPDTLVNRRRQGLRLDATEDSIIRQLPETGASLLRNIPRLEPVAEIVRLQSRAFSAGGNDLPVGARLLKVLVDLAELEDRGIERREALDLLRERKQEFDPRLLDAVTVHLAGGAPSEARAIEFAELHPGMILTTDVHSGDGLMLVPANTRVTPSILERLRNFNRLSGIREPLYIGRPDHETQGLSDSSSALES